MINWRIYYADGTAWDDTDGLWCDAPVDGVVAVAVRDENYGKTVLHGRDFFYNFPNDMATDIYCTSDIGPQLRQRCSWLKFGIGLPVGDWKRYLIQATKDPDFPPSQCPHRRSSDGT